MPKVTATKSEAKVAVSVGDLFEDEAGTIFQLRQLSNRNYVAVCLCDGGKNHNGMRGNKDEAVPGLTRLPVGTEVTLTQE